MLFSDHLLLELKVIHVLRFISPKNAAKCIYGGKVLAEGQRILTKTCRECHCHSLKHCLFPEWNFSESNRALSSTELLRKRLHSPGESVLQCLQR
ncbi:hypothetical protein lerEdw1_017109 [Lerista edwardsae]|nr:hypothetical protein lerEdw1_017109 [Lerista edwardsae]